MRTLIIPCAGKTQLNNMPKYLAKHPDGKILVKKSIEGLALDIFDRIIVTILEKDVIEFDAENIIKNSFSDFKNFEILVLKEETAGPADTIYETIKRAGVKDAVVIKDSDNFIKVDNINYNNFAAGLDLNEWDKDIHNLRNKSFLILNEQKQILDIFEKQFKSDVISLGMYGFASADDFVFAYERLKHSAYPINKLYVSHVISYLIGYSKKIFRYVPCDEYENWGDGFVWNEVNKAYATYFINLDAFNLNDDLVNKLQRLQHKGAKLIGFTSYDELQKANFESFFDQQNIKFLSIICDCSFSNIKTIIETNEQLDSLSF